MAFNQSFQFKSMELSDCLTEIMATSEKPRSVTRGHAQSLQPTSTPPTRLTPDNQQNATVGVISSLAIPYRSPTPPHTRPPVAQARRDSPDAPHAEETNLPSTRAQAVADSEMHLRGGCQEPQDCWLCPICWCFLCMSRAG